MQSHLKENIRIALNAIKGQMLRTILTALIISLGIAALVGTLTAIDVIKAALNSNFSSMGANTFTIRNRETVIRIGRGGKQPKRYRSITFREAMEFKERYNFAGTVSVSTMASMAATLKYKSIKTDPNVQVFGTDENYIETSGYSLSQGRNFTENEILDGANVAILGADMAKKLFKNEDPIGQVISVGSGKYSVIGVLASKGASMGFGGDKIALLPVENVRQYFSRPDMTFTINVLAENAALMEMSIAEATGIFRIIRKCEIDADDNFEITKSDTIAATLIDNLSYVTAGATIIGIITLLGAAIGLMNIMLVSVTERTREIGTRKALGATRSDIRNQFLVEAVVICQVGGLMGVLLALLLGLGVSAAFDSAFIMPWGWILLGLGICLAVGLVSGLYPAVKASKLDPIEALRYE
jgi:putative ABC transport system permease protein